MKRVVPSTPCDLSLVIHREVGRLTHAVPNAKFGYTKEVINNLIDLHDTVVNPIVSIDVRIKIQGRGSK